ncbi:hypothetical protein [Bosea sp. 685]|nr:hypothetical protein [Bosea sp. 685]WNJ89616.1 hypothetical protein RMR04_24930 [Bosea sp. 685]
MYELARRRAISTAASVSVSEPIWSAKSSPPVRVEMTNPAVVASAPTM